VSIRLNESKNSAKKIIFFSSSALQAAARLALRVQLARERKSAIDQARVVYSAELEASSRKLSFAIVVITADAM
jgi:hypothetical protein